MKTKTFTLIVIAIVMGLFTFSSCNRLPVPTPPSTVKSVRDLVVSPTFTWKTTKLVSVNVAVPSWVGNQTLKIYSIDNANLYYIGFPGANGYVQTQITVPAATNMLKLEYGSGNVFNSILVGVDNQLTYNYNSFKNATSAECDLSGEKTYSQGGWNANPHGNNPGTLLNNHFSDVFPKGLIIGDPDHNTIKLTSAKAVRDFLPGGGKSKILNRNYTNPKSRYRVAGNWGGQICAAIINVEMNKAGFLGSSNPKLEDLIFRKTAFEDMSIKDFLVLANKAIGGGGLGGYKINDFKNAAYLINKNFDKDEDDNENLNYFTCPAAAGTTPCGCKKGLTSIKLKYNGTVAATIKVRGEHSGDILYNHEVQPNGLFTVQGTGSDGKLDHNIDFYVNGSKNTTIHTSCSVKLYIGDEYGKFTIEDGISKGNIHLCTKTTSATCGCDKQLYSLKLRYDGPSEVEVKVKEKKRYKRIYCNDVKPGESFTFNGSGKDGKMYKIIYIYEDNKKNTTINTDCKSNIKVGDKFGDFTVMAGTSKNNKELCGTTPGGGGTTPGGGGTTTPPNTGSTTSTFTGSLAYEDLWPYMGDYDFNDVVVDYTLAVTKDAQDRVQNIDATIILEAFGASYHNGFGFQLPNVAPDQVISVTGYNLASNSYIHLASNGLEAGHSKATVIAFDDAWRLMQWPGLGIGVNTNMAAPFVTPDTLVIHMILYNNNAFAPGGPVTFNQLDIGNWNPFVIQNKNRKVEIHLPNHPPTSLMDKNLLGTGDDASNPATGTYFKTAKNLPWAINIPVPFAWPIEKQDITGAYLHFAEWAQSDGVLFPDWYSNKPGYRNASLIYTPH